MVVFVFRGQSSSAWSLTNSIERAVTNYPKYGKGYEVQEQWMMHEFKRKYPLFSTILPKQVDSFEWLAIMQHHGAPTRLLDFTESILIATYFAVVDTLSESCIWIVNKHRLRDNLLEDHNLNYISGVALKDDINEVHIDFANRFIGNKVSVKEEDIPDTVIPLDPKICTERLSRQQGLFLMPTNAKLSFIENLTSAFRKNKFEFETIVFDNFLKNIDAIDVDVLKINIPVSLHNNIIYSLAQMNITAETLFPGIDGLAKSLHQSHIRL